MAIDPAFILLFLDGLGLGAAGPQNPLSLPGTTPFLTAYLGQPLVNGLAVQTSTLLAKPIDATLGIPGLPQSATGQTTLYTGQNAAQFRGQHQSGFANGSLRQLIEGTGLFKQVLNLGKRPTLANVYSPAYFEAIAQRRRRYSVCTLLNLTAGLTFRMPYEYEQGQAVYWDITGERLSRYGLRRAEISVMEAGRRLLNLSQRHAVTLLECYLPDEAGHAQDYNQAQRSLSRIDQLIDQIVAGLAPNTTLIVTSDHGNIEDLSTPRHTCNSVPLLAFGPEAPAFATVTSLVEITPTLVRELQQPNHS
ncbi:MAG: alkaline phosphatase family protein [Cyanobacteria bacterium J06632_22]